MTGYLGAKTGSGVYQAIVNLIPPHDVYIEPFLGTGAIMKRKAPAARNIGVDMDKRCIDRFDVAAVENLELFCADAFAFLRAFPFDGSRRAVVYLDPPYLPETRTSHAKYKHELTTAQHVELLRLAKQLPAFILISGYESDLYNEELRTWHKFKFQAMSRGGVRTEVVWYNFEPREMHYHTYAGKNSSDRQRIQRKAERWANKIKALPPGEKQAVIAAILAADQV